jgi:AAA domain-containing protein
VRPQAGDNHSCRCPVCHGNAGVAYLVARDSGQVEPFVNCFTASCRSLGGAYLRELAAALGLAVGASKDEIVYALLANQAARPRRRREPVPLPSQATLDGAVARLHSTDGADALAYLVDERGLSVETIRAAGIGYVERPGFGPWPNMPAFVLPASDAAGKLVTVRKRFWPDAPKSSSGKPAKMASLRGHPAALYPNVPPGGRLIVCEGEFDCLRLRQEQFPAVTSTAGTYWNDEWNRVVRGREVAVVYDVGSFEQARKLAASFRAAGANEAWAVDLAVFGLDTGEDVSDFLRCYEREPLRLLLNESRAWERGERAHGIRRAGARVLGAAQRKARITKPAASNNGFVTHSLRPERVERIRSAWEQRVLLRTFNLLVGEEGLGKSNLAAWIAAHLTRGKLAGDLKGRPVNVLFIGDEDEWNGIWVPRLLAAGVDGERAKFLESGPHGAIDVRKDAAELHAYIAKRRFRFVFFDQLLDNLGYKTDSWKEKDVREALHPLRVIARETDSAMLASLHPNKRKGSFRDSIAGTSAFNAVSRSSLLVMRHPEFADRRVVVRAKGNYSYEPDAFEFTIEPTTIRNEREAIEISRIAEERESGLRAHTLLNEVGRQIEDSKLGRARTDLRKLFSDGRERPAAEVIEQFGRTHAIEARMLRRAADEVGLRRRRRGMPSKVYWRLPDAET